MLEFNREKLRRMQSRRDQLAAVVNDFSQRLRETRAELRTVAEQHRRITTGESFGTKRELTAIERDRLDELGSTVDLLDSELQQATERFDLIGPVVSRCTDWLAGRGPQRGGDYSPVQPAKDASKTTQRLDKLRAEIEALIEQRATIEGAPLPRAEALRRIDTWIADQASEFRLNATAAEFSRHGGQVHADALKLSRVATPFTEGTSLVRLDLAPLICSLLPEQTKARLAGEITIDDGDPGRRSCQPLGSACRSAARA